MRGEILYEDKNLPVWAVVKRSYAYFWRQRALLAVPLALLFAAEIAVGLISLGIAFLTARLTPELRVLIDLCWSLLTLTVLLSFTVGLHRTVLLDEIREGAAFLRWDRYLWNSLKAALLALLVSNVLMAVFTGALVFSLGLGNLMVLFLLHPWVIYTLLFVAWIVALYVWLRVGLAFPAAALGYRHVFSLSWRIAEGNVLRLLGTLLLASLPFLLPAPLLAWSLKAVLLTEHLSTMGVGAFALFWLVLSALLNLVALSVLTIATSLNFFFLFKASDEFGEV